VSSGTVKELAETTIAMARKIPVNFFMINFF